MHYICADNHQTSLSLMKQFAEETLIMVLTAVAFVAFIAMACYLHDTFEYIPQ